jgi:alpha-L-rhamnosidase
MPSSSTLPAAESTNPVNLRTEYCIDPLGVDSREPRLSWQMQSGIPGQKQTAYHVLVAGSRDHLDLDQGDLWDSGKVGSSQSIHVLYAGKPLASQMRCFWKVRVWEKDGHPSNWSETAEWTMGLLEPEAWACARWMRAPFALGVPENPPPVTAEMVRKAIYQTSGGRRQMDVTELLKEKMCPGVTFIVDPGVLGPDFRPGDSKELEVEIEADGEFQTVSAVDFSPLLVVPMGVPAPWMRRTFELDRVPERTLVRVESRGYHELWVNGRKAGESILNPAVTVFKRRTFYVTYDITDLVREGGNGIGIWLGRGWNILAVPGVEDERPLVRFHMECCHAGQTTELVSDQSWVTSVSSYRTLGHWAWSAHGGELFDARMHRDSWSEFDDEGSWEPVEIVPDLPGQSCSQMAPLTRIGKRILAISCEKQEDGSYVIDFGTDLTGWLEMKMPVLERGRKVSFEYQESGGRHYGQWDHFISGGGPEEIFICKFNYRGFRAVKVTGLASVPDLEHATALLVDSDLEPAGSFDCSNDLINWIHATDLWTIRCLNLGSYMCDCPHRERLGYGDGQIAIESTVMNFWAPAFYNKWARDWADTEGPNGELPMSTPYHPAAQGELFGRESPPGWGGALLAIVWRTYLYYGDTRLVEELLPSMKRFVERIESHCHGNIFRAYGDEWQALGDWVAPERGMDTKNWPSIRANELFNNCYRIYLWEMVAKFHEALGHHEEAAKCRAHIETIRPLIHEAFYEPENGHYVIDEQAYQVMPLLAGVVPGSLRADIMKKLEELILVTRGGHLDTGMLGTYFLFQYLSEIGRNDLLFTIATQTGYPGWGHMREEGATTFWEQWNGFWSRIHSCFTGPAGWIQNALGGIRPDPASPGFQHFIIKPALVGDLAWVKSHHDSAYGRIESNWKRDGDRVTLDITVPPNSTATVFVPASGADPIMVNGRSAKENDHVAFVRSEDSAAVFAVDSGTYTFTATREQ